jgi:hypothetical protein
VDSSIQFVEYCAESEKQNGDFGDATWWRVVVSKGMSPTFFQKGAISQQQETIMEQMI